MEAVNWSGGGGSCCVDTGSHVRVSEQGRDVIRVGVIGKTSLTAERTDWW